jgi:hypothetical protein
MPILTIVTDKQTMHHKISQNGANQLRDDMQANSIWGFRSIENDVSDDAQRIALIWPNQIAALFIEPDPPKE